MIGTILSEFYDRVGWSKAEAAYVARHQLDLDVVNTHAGIFAIVGCTMLGNGRFRLDDGCGPHAVVEVLGDDASTTVDLCAWPLDSPETFATIMGAPALGLSNVNNPASWFMRRALRMHRTPLAWLKAGCEGAVILDHRHVVCWLGQALGPIAAEDVEHGRAIEMMLRPRGGPDIVVPRRPAVRRAA